MENSNSNFYWINRNILLGRFSYSIWSLSVINIFSSYVYDNYFGSAGMVWSNMTIDKVYDLITSNMLWIDMASNIYNSAHCYDTITSSV